MTEHLAERQRSLLPSGRQSKDGRRFSWCGEVFDFLIEGLGDRLAARGITFTAPFPGPFRLLDEDRRPDGHHVRRFWTTALAGGCRIARLCTLFHHRHDEVRLPEPPQVRAYPIQPGARHEEN